MYVGKTLFAQIMNPSNHRIVARHGGDNRVRTLTCAEHFSILAFTQLTDRESLRDIEAFVGTGSTTWTFAKPCPVLRWPMPTSCATGAFTMLK